MSELSEGFRVILSDHVQALDSVIEKYEALKWLPSNFFVAIFPLKGIF